MFVVHRVSERSPAMAVRLIYMVMLRISSWLALLCRRRSVLITEAMTLRHEVRSYAAKSVHLALPGQTGRFCRRWHGYCLVSCVATDSLHPPRSLAGTAASSHRNGLSRARREDRPSMTNSANWSSA